MKPLSAQSRRSLAFFVNRNLQKVASLHALL